MRCAIYTRKSTEEGLDQEFNSLDAQHEAAIAFIRDHGAKGIELLKKHGPEAFKLAKDLLPPKKNG